MLIVFGFSACDDEDSVTPVPVIGTITDIAAADSRFSTLVTALQRTGLDAVLDRPAGEFTVFAPTDEAFAASGIDLNSLTDEQLTNVLLYHVIGGQTIQAANIPGGRTEIASLNTTGPGEASLPLTIDNNGSGVVINGNTNVVVTDVIAVNGVIHAIDRVLLPPTVLDRAALDGRFTILAAALARTGLDDVVSGEGTFTVFAPTDEAFAGAGVDLDALSDDDLRNILLYHVLTTAVPAGAIADGDNFVTTVSATGPDAAPLSLLVNQTGGNVTLNDDATVVVADVNGSNGVVHAIDKILMPQSVLDFATKAGGTSELAGAVMTAGLVDALSGEGPFTVLAPVNAAFEAIADVAADLTTEQLQEVLTYHVVSSNVRSDDLSPGMVPSLNETNMIDVRQDDNGFYVQSGDTRVDFVLNDIQATNGVIHLINTVLIPRDL